MNTGSSIYSTPGRFCWYHSNYWELHTLAPPLSFFFMHSWLPVWPLNSISRTGASPRRPSTTPVSLCGLYMYCHLALQIVHRRSTLLYHSLPTIILPHSIFFSFILSSSNSFCRKWDWFGRFSDHGKPKCCQGLGRGVCFTFNDCSTCFGCLCLFLVLFLYPLQLFFVSNLDLSNPSTFTDQSNGWRYSNGHLTSHDEHVIMLLCPAASWEWRKRFWYWRRNPKSWVEAPTISKGISSRRP